MQPVSGDYVEPEHLCESCNAEPIVGVASSGLGAISLAWGANCLRSGAEPLWLLLGQIEDMEGPVPFVRDVAIADWVLDGITAYRDGEYVLARDIAQCPRSAEVDRFVGEGCPNDLAGWAYELMQHARDKARRANEEHAASGPHEGCTCCYCFEP